MTKATAKSSPAAAKPKRDPLTRQPKASAKAKAKSAASAKPSSERHRRPRTHAADPASSPAAAATAAMTAAKLPNGKLGLLVEQMAREDGATLAELMAKTSWQPHTVRAALSRLRQRGYTVRLETIDARQAYRLAPAAA